MCLFWSVSLLFPAFTNGDDKKISPLSFCVVYFLVLFFQALVGSSWSRLLSLYRYRLQIGFMEWMDSVALGFAFLPFTSRVTEVADE